MWCDMPVRRLVLCVVLLAGAGSDSPPAALKTRIDRFAKPLVEKKYGVVGLMVGVSKPDGGREFHGYGKTKLDGFAPTKQTLFEIGSVTKTFTGLLLAQMVESKQLKLDDPVRLRLPADFVMPKRGQQELTLLELATHSSGLPRLPPNQYREALLGGLIAAFSGGDPLQDPYGRFDAAQLRKGLAEIKLKRQQTPKFDYSNLGVGLLGFSLSHKAGTTYEQLVRTRITEPLGMDDTVQHVSEKQRARLADGHADKSRRVDRWTFTDAAAGAGGLCSTAEDMIVLLEAESGRTQTRLAAAMQMTQEKRVTLSSTTGLGIAWFFIDLPRGHRVWWHSGATNGYSSFAAFCRAPQAAVVLLCNTGPLATGGAIDKFGLNLIGEMIGDEVKGPQ
jgi:serine-type D-Ala-D-Ala carboxypeptidase/endopeptidase